MVAQAEAGVVVQDIHQVAEHAPALEHGARGVEADRGEVEVVRVERRHVGHHAEIERADAQAVGRQRAPVLEQQDPRAIGTDEGDGEVGDARIADEQADIQRGDDAVQVVGQVDVGDGVVEDRHRHGGLGGDDRADGVEGQAEDWRGY